MTSGSSSLFARYKKERENVETIETPIGFALYKFVSDDSCYLIDIYIVPEARRSGAGTHLADQVVEIARSKGLKYLLGSVDSKAQGSSDSLKVLLAYGFELLKNEGQLCLFRKEI